MNQWHRLTLEEIISCSGHEVTVDVETNGLHWWKNHIIGVGIHCPSAGVSGYYPTLTPIDRKEAKEAIKKWREGTIFIAHNLKFELHFLDIDPFEQKWKYWDTTILAHLYDSRLKKSLKELEKLFLGTSTKEEFVAKAPYKQRNRIWEWSLDLVAPYCINDCIQEHKLFEVLSRLVEEEGLWKLFLKESIFLREVWKTERNGMLLDVEFLNTAIKVMATDIREAEQELYDSVGYTFNWKSPQQLSKAIYEDMGIEKPKNPFADKDGVDKSRFAGRDYNSTMTKTFLLMEKVHHPLGELIAHLRESAKLKKMMEKWLELRDSNDRVHPTFNMARTRTGRLSSSEPNAQNTPSEVRTRYTQSVYSGEGFIRAESYNLRKAFIAPEGRGFVSVDYSQMEMRMFGIVSGDPFMLDSLKAGKDVHADIAEQVWGHRDKNHREWAKTISFGLIYGMTAGSLMNRLNIKTIREAKALQQQYFDTFPSIPIWLNATIEECKTYGYITYWSGRKWREENPKDMYKAGNALIQGGCADFLSVMAIRVGKWLRENIPSAHIVNYVHDELIVECDNEDIPAVRKAMEQIMAAEDIFELPWKTSTAIGPSYGELEKLTGEY